MWMKANSEWNKSRKYVYFSHDRIDSTDGNFPLATIVPDLEETFENTEILVAFFRNFDIRKSWWFFIPILPRGNNKTLVYHSICFRKNLFIVG